MELIKCIRDHAGARSMLFFFWEISKNEYFQEILKMIFLWRGTLRVLRAETWLTVYRTIAIRKQWLSPPDLGPHKMVRHRPKMIELAMFCIMKCM